MISVNLICGQLQATACNAHVHASTVDTNTRETNKAVKTNEVGLNTF